MTSPLNHNSANSSPPIHSEEFLADIAAYESKLKNKNLPVVFSLPHLCLLAGVNIQKIKELCETNRIDEYKRFKLKKKRGGYRVIQTPTDELKYLQKWILVNILDNVQSHSSCKGFEKNLSIKNNAEVHLNKDSILKIDLLRFFDSINEKRVYGLFKHIGYHPNLAVSLAKICTIVPDSKFLSSFKKKELELKSIIMSKLEGVLPQGAPGSPKLSNLITTSLDNRLSKLAVKNELCYSRYADDITFSGNIATLNKIKSTVYRIIKDENLFVNHSKTKILIKGNPFFITGLSVNNEKVTIPKKRKIDIEHHLFHCIKNGVEEHLSKCGITNKNFKDWLLGNIAFVFSVEKELGEKYFADYNKIQWPI
jgi:RNA-directed DNA polymerase